VPSHSADPPSCDAAAVAVPALRSGLAAELHSPATADDAGDVPGETAGISFPNIYGYDAAGNPTLTAPAATPPPTAGHRTDGAPGRNRLGLPRRALSALRPASGARRAERRTKRRRRAEERRGSFPRASGPAQVGCPGPSKLAPALTGGTAADGPLVAEARRCNRPGNAARGRHGGFRAAAACPLRDAAPTRERVPPGPQYGSADAGIAVTVIRA
jgi:hypothetical protein